LHLSDTKMAPRLKFWLQALQTSSPPYPVMVSLDLVRRLAALKGKALFSACWRWAQHFRKQLEKNGFILLSSRKEGGFNLDPCRITIIFSRGEGQRLARELARRYRLQVEMSERSFLLAIAGPAVLSCPPASCARAFVRARDKISPAYSGPGAPVFNCSADFPPSFFSPKGACLPFCLPPGEALHTPSVAVPLEEASGKVCSEMVVLSPPGIPLLSPGEIIREEAVAYLLQRRAQNKLFQGASDPALKTIRVLTEGVKMW